MATEIYNPELVSLKKKIEEIDETLEIVFRLMEKRLSKLENYKYRKVQSGDN